MSHGASDSSRPILDPFHHDPLVREGAQAQQERDKARAEVARLRDLVRHLEAEVKQLYRDAAS